MFQAINQINPPTFRIFFLLLLSSAWLDASPETGKKTCSLVKDGTPVAFFLSRAYGEQREGFHKTDQRKPEEAKKHHETAVQFFEKFHTCQKENGETPTYLSSMSLATSYMELGNLDEALNWSEVAYQMFLSPKVPPREIILLKSRILLRKGELEAAGSTLESNLKNYPFDIDFLYYLGNIHYDLKKWNQSILYFISLADVIERRDTNSKLKPTILKFLGDLNYRLDYSRRSIFHYQNYSRYINNDIEVQFRIAQIYFTLGEFGNAKKYLSQMRTSNPRDIDASHMLGELYFIDSRLFASQYFTVLESEKKIPKEGAIYLISRFLRQETEGLSAEVDTFITKNPNRLSTRILYADLMSGEVGSKRYKATLDAGQWAFQYRQYVTAEKYFLRALDLAKSTPEFESDIPLLYEKISHCKESQSHIQSAILSMRLALGLAKTDEMRDAFKFRLSYLLMNESVKKYSEAIRLSDELITSNPTSGNYHYLKGLLFLQKEDFKNAMLSLKKSVDYDPKNPNHLFYLAIAYDKLNDFPNAEICLKTAIEISPGASNSYNYLGYLYAEKGINVDVSEKLLLKATELEPDNPAYQDSIGWVYFKQARLQDALLHLHFAELISIDRDMEDPVILDHLGDVYSKKADLIKADHYFEKALLLSKDEKEKAKIKQKKQTINKELSK
ncbi:hypothetical protein EHQ58_07995 [Leptospira ognonensis]|uniref:Tetratricopeptide repeat protein n=1 Tax=Leptospira ognonensis TaxID=2484945 RepID=A0A4R9K5N7_9LEPT|nr:tetratricopeptide repeat protein [Leptospira ognonensis]TGL59678.1 hypothetical protein EHQ58_07995 [Leptospira ognonensis]